MDDLHRQQTEIIERDIKTLADRFDRHLEIYAQNNKELQSVKTNQIWLMRFFWVFMTPLVGGIIYIIINLPT